MNKNTYCQGWKSIEISEQKMYQQGQHFNKHGREMGYTGEKECKRFKSANIC